MVTDRTSTTGRSRSTSYASGSESVTTKLRMRWTWVLLAALLGAALGAAMTRGLVTYETSAVMRINDPTGDSNRIKQVGQTVERTALSSNVLSAAADERGISTAELASRTSAEWQTDTDVVDITVRGSNADGIVDDANAVVDSLSDFYDQQTEEVVRELGRQGNELLTSGRLRSEDAEAQRRAGVGASLADRQGVAAFESTTVALLDSASPATAAGMSLPVGLVLGGFVGAALSAAAALLLPVRRRRLRRASDVPALLPGVRAASDADSAAGEVAGLFIESERADLVVVAMEGAEEAAYVFGANVVALLQAHGVAAAIGDANDASPGKSPVTPGATDSLGGRSAPHRLGRSGRDQTRGKLSVSALVLVTTDRSGSLSLLAGQSEILAVVLARSGAHAVEEVERVVDQLRHSDPTVVLVP